MSTRLPVVLILGAGGNVGASVARAFAGKGYKVAVSSRTEKADIMKGSNPPLYVPGDFSDPESVPRVFSNVREKLGVPGVVIYNGEHETHLSSVSLKTCNQLTIILSHVRQLRAQPVHHDRIHFRSHSRATMRTWHSTPPVCLSHYNRPRKASRSSPETL